MPRNLGFKEAAAVPMGALSAWQALFVQAGVQSGKSVQANEKKSILVLGASGGVGLWAVQFARWAGCGRVVGVVGRGWRGVC